MTTTLVSFRWVLLVLLLLGRLAARTQNVGIGTTILVQTLEVHGPKWYACWLKKGFPIREPVLAHTRQHWLLSATTYPSPMPAMA